MKKVRLSVCFVAAILFCFNAFAGEVTKAEAIKVAKNHYYEITAAKTPYERIQIASSYDMKRGGEVVYYAFNLEQGGYVIVSAEDQYTPIIGYSDKGTFSYDDAPAHYQWLMDEYANMILYMRANDIALAPQETAKWQRLMTDNPETLQPQRANAIIGPLCGDILWNQDYPYNYYCPVDPESKGPSKRAYAGCVATAMSIVMYYWRWPLQGEGAYSYTPGPISPCEAGRYPKQTVNFGETTYDYDGMAYSSDNRLHEPLSLLMYHCGVAVDMKYCWEGSGTQTGYIAYAARKYFKYDPSITEFVHTNNATWIARFKQDLDQYRPICMGGSVPGATTGHAFVCDGYDSEDMFHYNFGWSGSGNGYYSPLNPDGYSAGMRAVVNIFPDDSKGYPYNCSRNVVLPYINGTITDCALPTEKYQGGITASWLINPQLNGTDVNKITMTCGNAFDIAAGDLLRIYDGSNASAPLLVEATGTTPFAEVSTTGNTMFVTFTSAAGSPGGEGFRISYHSECTPTCNSGTQTITAYDGVITDGSAPDKNYAVGQTCTWMLDLPYAEEVIFQFEYLDTEIVDDVRIDDITHNKPIATYGGTYSSTTLPEIPIVNAQKIRVRFASNPAGGTGKGFSLNYFSYPHGPNAIKENTAVSDLMVYPNPVSSQLTVSFSTTTTDDVSIVLYSITGQRIYQEILNKFMGKYTHDINVSDLARGIYLLQINSTKGSTTQKVVVQ